MYDFFFAHDYVTLSFFLYLSFFFSTFSVRLSVKASVCLSVCMGNLLPQVSFNPRPCQRGSCGHSCYLPATLCSLCQYCDIVSLSDMREMRESTTWIKKIPTLLFIVKICTEYNFNSF